MKIALISANIGGFDRVHVHKKQNVEYEYLYFDKCELDHLSNRMQAKYGKMQAHKFVDADVFIWIDGSFQIIEDDFIEFLMIQLVYNEIAMPLHPKRPNAYEEMNFLISCLDENEKYVSDRYKGIKFEQELDFYMANYFPVNYPLYACGVFARLNNEKVNKFFDAWWQRCLEFSEFDQGLFSFEAWRHGIKINSFPFDTLERYTKRHKHTVD